MDEQLFRKKSLDKVSSPEALNDYLRVTSPTVWLILAAIILLLAGFLLWSSTATIDSIATGTAQVEGGNMRIRFDDQQVAAKVQSGMRVTAGENESRIAGVGTDEKGEIFASAPTDLADGVYPVKVIFRQTQVMSLLFN